MPAPRRTVIGLAAMALTLTTACGDLDQAASAQGITKNDLASELATQLGGSSTRTFTATYQLPGRARATVTQAQNPPRTAYEYPGGRLHSTAEAVTTCKGKTCTTTPAGGTLPATAFEDAHRAGLITPATVLALLNETALDNNATLAPRDTTIAGLHATCLDVDNLSDDRIRTFHTCITSDGILGTFTGRLDGREIDMAMTQYSGQAPDEAFELPADTKVTTP